VGFSIGVAQAQLADPGQLATSTSGKAMLVGGGLDFPGNVKAPFKYGEKMYFTASVPTKKGKGTVTRLFSCVHGGKATQLTINPKEDNMNAANATLSIGGDRIYYTVSKETPVVKLAESQIWYRDRQYDGTWGPIIQLPKHINLSGVLNTQPTSGYDFKLKKEVVFFASNRPGGKGGMDIWYTTVERDGTFGPAVNLPSNTEFDEVTPHFSTHLQMLFFSSNMPGGLGGFDIYRMGKNEAGEWQWSENLTAANSSSDDLYFCYHQPTQTCYFSSNRPNENCKSNPKHCADLAIFSAKLPGCLILEIRSQLDSMPLYGCNVELENLETGQIEVTYLNAENNSFNIPIFEGKKYRLIVSRPYHFPVFLPLEHEFCDFAHPIRKVVYLQPMN
jgi:hypothetical protein